MSGLQGGSSFTGEGGFSGSGSFSLDMNGAGNLNGNMDIDGSLSQGEQDEQEYMDIQNDARQQETNRNNNDNRGNKKTMDNKNGVPGSQQYGNVNSQTAVYQSGIGNSNTQGGVMQQPFRRQNKPIHHEVNQRIVCGYRYRTVYPSLQLHNLNIENEIIQAGLGNDETSIGQYAMRREFSGPFNHLM